ncbi:Efflux RND transporter periplasmic adaptor subunit [Rhodovastum atsumiense]|uniref:Efflux RND transporter periplasmic adaptor subunit n=1 Tax=Rhodovastum atsumiense TaxID=504468 RepID=A0A5M6ITZ8_9PROT|nr:efflux RND transporter periplasmic adaptor subunit [Rhodovastum atsumiense]KAA5611691.1 efflux RND transporter periplasmic adaptor subunit [Rhodovastum atsumiense]CAH2604264.1 Efflux RND transporter periplasmic adaptor subunit [Rhodovastum atsumiense]
MAVRLLVVVLAFAVGCAMPARAQMGPPGPPAVGVITAERKPITETNEFVGRIQATDRVDIVARVTAFLQERLFTEGVEVQKGDLLYRLERPPFEADLQAKLATVAQMQALLRNATITLNRAQTLLNTPAGQRSQVDDALAQQASYAAQLQGAQAQARSSQINLDYTEIHAPIAGKIGRTTVTTGNVVGPTTGVLTTIVSQDPMYVLFPIAVRTGLDLRNRYADKGGFAAVKIRVRLPDGVTYPLDGQLDYVDPTVAQGTDTIMLRGRVPNPLRPGAKQGEPGNRQLVDGMFVTVLLEGVEPVLALAIPRSAVLSDQQGNFVYVVDKDNKAQQRRIQLGQSTPDTAVVMAGLQPGEQVITDGIQRVRPGVVVNPGPAAAAPKAPPSGSPASSPARN